MKPRIISADCPWNFETYSDKATKSASKHYHTMNAIALCQLPVREVVADDAILLQWATWPQLWDALIVGEAWGFTYKTLAFNWIKLGAMGKALTGLGYYTRANSEPCLLFTRGKVERSWIKDKGISQLLWDDPQQFLPGFGDAFPAASLAHSAKPEIFYQTVERLVDGPYLELFGRHKRQGWTVLGNEVTGNDIREDLEQLKRSQNEN